MSDPRSDGYTIATRQEAAVHNDSGNEAELLIFSNRLEPAPSEKQDDFWPA